MSSWDVKSCDVLSQPFDLTHIAIEDEVEWLDLEQFLFGFGTISIWIYFEEKEKVWIENNKLSPAKFNKR